MKLRLIAAMLIVTTTAFAQNSAIELLGQDLKAPYRDDSEELRDYAPAAGG